MSREAGAFDAIICSHFARGGAGARALAEAVERAAQQPHDFRFLYDVTLPIVEKIRIIAREIYGAQDVSLTEQAQAQVDRYTAQVGQLSSARGGGRTLHWPA